MVKYANHWHYIQKLRRMLLGAGTVGLSQSDLNQRSRTKVFQVEHMLETLEEWKRRGWVQSFRVRGPSGHPMMIWRATNKLRDDWSIYN